MLLFSELVVQSEHFPCFVGGVMPKEVWSLLFWFVLWALPRKVKWLAQRHLASKYQAGVLGSALCALWLPAPSTLS